MNFDLSDEQRMLQETVQQFIDNECPPTRLREIFDAEDAHDPTLWKGLVEMGFAGLAIPDEHGGAGLELLDLAVVVETMGRGALPGPFFNHVIAGLAIAYGGSDAQKKNWLPKLAAGDAIGTFAFSDSDGGWQPDEWTLDGSGVLTGIKPTVPFATLADVMVVGVRGGGLVLVESSTETIVFHRESQAKDGPGERVLLAKVGQHPIVKRRLGREVGGGRRRFDNLEVRRRIGNEAQVERVRCGLRAMLRGER